MALTKAQKAYIEENQGLKLSQLAKDVGLSKEEVTKFLSKLPKDTKTSTEVKQNPGKTHMETILENSTNKKYGAVVATEAMSQLADATRRISRTGSLNRFIHKPKGDKK